MVKLPPDLDFDVDEARYGKSFDVTNPDHLTEEIINGHIVCQMGFYHKENCRGQTMYNLFQEDFEGFTLDIFKMAHKNALRRLRDFLIAHEVWVKPAGGSTSYAKALHDCLTEATPAEWTEERVKEREQIKGRQKTIQSQTQPIPHQPYPVPVYPQQSFGWPQPGYNCYWENNAQQQAQQGQNQQQVQNPQSQIQAAQKDQPAPQTPKQPLMITVEAINVIQPCNTPAYHGMDESPEQENDQPPETDEAYEPDYHPEDLEQPDIHGKELSAGYIEIPSPERKTCRNCGEAFSSGNSLHKHLKIEAYSKTLGKPADTDIEITAEVHLGSNIKAKMLVGVDILDIEDNIQIRRSARASKKQKRLYRLLSRMPRMLRLPRLLRIPQMFRPSHPLRVFRPPCLRDPCRLSYCSIHLPT
jgi:hypothetical protein